MKRIIKDIVRIFLSLITSPIQIIILGTRTWYICFHNYIELSKGDLFNVNDEQIEGGELCEYEACEVPISQIKKMIKNGTWIDSLEEEEVLYNLEHNLYSKSYAELVRKTIKGVKL